MNRSVHPHIDAQRPKDTSHFPLSHLPLHFASPPLWRLWPRETWGRKEVKTGSRREGVGVSSLKLHSKQFDSPFEATDALILRVSVFDSLPFCLLENSFTTFQTSANGRTFKFFPFCNPKISLRSSPSAVPHMDYFTSVPALLLTSSTGSSPHEPNLTCKP